MDGARGAGWGHVGLGGAYVTNYPSLLPRVGETHYKRGNSAHPSRHSSLIRPAGHDQGDYPHPRGINSECVCVWGGVQQYFLNLYIYIVI